MTDQEKMIALFNEFGMEFNITGTHGTVYIGLESGDAKVDGYIGFQTEFSFDENGKFIKAFIYE